MNPARDLYEILKKWKSAQGSHADSQRGLDMPAGMAEHFRAVNCIEDCKRILATVETEDDNHPEIHKALNAATWTVFHYPYSWQNQTTVVDETTLAVLSLFPTMVDQWLNTRRIPVKALQENAPGIREHVDNFKIAVSDDKSLPDYFKRHVHRLANNIIGMLDDIEQGGTTSLSEALDELWVYIDHARTTSENEKTRRTANSFFTFIRDLFAPALGGFAGSLGSAAAQQMLPGG